MPLQLSHLPITLRDIHGNPVECTFTTPTINNSSLPALLGLNSLINVGAVMDFRNMKLHFTGPGSLEYESHLPEGTQTFDLHQAPSGHVMLPCCKYATPQEQQRLRQQQTDTLTLHTTSSSSTTPPTTEPTPQPQQDTATNPWNAFQHRYKGQGLTKENFTGLYYWSKRSEFEKTCNETEVVQQFHAYLAECKKDTLPRLVEGDNETE